MVLPQQATAVSPQALEGLADISTPAPVSWTPQTWGWTALAIIASAALALWLWRWRKRALANRYRKEALGLLSALEPLALDPRTRHDALGQIAELIKRTSLAAYSRESVARLAGVPWVTFLRARGFGATDVPAELLAELQYRSPASSRPVSEADTPAFIGATRTWIREHRVSA